MIKKYGYELMEINTNKKLV